MESHQVHSHATEKKFKHYLFEFFMLFLAVTLGFLVENERDKLVDHSREKEYIHSIAEDLKQDILQLDTLLKRRNLKNQMMDSLLNILNYTNPHDHGNDLYYFARWVPRTYRFYSNDRTILQLNSGNWRLVRNNKVSDALLTYHGITRSITTFIEQREENLIILMYPSLNRLFDNRVFEKMVDGLSFNKPGGNPQLLLMDPALINEFCNQLHFVKNANFYFITVAEQLIKKATGTLAVLKSEYHLQ